jgi:hypothetical protein
VIGPADLAVVDRWWQEFVATGRLPAELQLVHGRLVRAVGRGELPSGPVHVKGMAFPRAKDRLRYACRSLPGAHEAAMLRAVAAAGVPCPEVLAVRTCRRLGLPFRSLLVLRTLPVVADTRPPRARLRAEAELVARLLAAGIAHRDLHGGNFVALADGRLAVLDLQSASRVAPARTGAAGWRLAVAARMLRERQGLADDDGLAELREAGLLHSDAEAGVVRARLGRERRHYLRTRVERCLGESTEFTRRWCWTGREFRRRGDLGPGRWWWDRRAEAAWLGQRFLQLQEGRPALFPAFFRSWWWLGGGAGLYVPAACDDEQIEREVRAAVVGSARMDRIVERGEPETK